MYRNRKTSIFLAGLVIIIGLVSFFAVGASTNNFESRKDYFEKIKSANHPASDVNIIGNYTIRCSYYPIELRLEDQLKRRRQNLDAEQLKNELGSELAFIVSISKSGQDPLNDIKILQEGKLKDNLVDLLMNVGSAFNAKDEKGEIILPKNVISTRNYGITGSHDIMVVFNKSDFNMKGLLEIDMDYLKSVKLGASFQFDLGKLDELPKIRI
jgi:hypothetical protein